MIRQVRDEIVGGVASADHGSFLLLHRRQSRYLGADDLLAGQEVGGRVVALESK